jgi:hypothetical protein
MNWLQLEKVSNENKRYTIKIFLRLFKIWNAFNVIDGRGLYSNFSLAAIFIQ